ncbi:hypothetical protein HQ571_00600 [Candidatus Kuenenbacteria bacterium]|nr:hypothetical protein [Candidatus Kuenenbacteria bacterium]
MKKTISRIVFAVLVISAMVILGCGRSETEKVSKKVDEQQAHYGDVQALPFYDFSIPRDIMIQIYNVVTQEARNTFTVIETVTGVTKFRGASIGYGIPADTSLTNPLKPAYKRANNQGEIVGQAEPNGLYSSVNTDGTWVLFVDSNGDITPIYTEHKATTFPFVVKKDDNGGWVRADNKKATMTIELNTGK